MKKTEKKLRLRKKRNEQANSIDPDEMDLMFAQTFFQVCSVERGLLKVSYLVSAGLRTR